MTQPVIITVAITGAVPRKKDNPAIPVTPGTRVTAYRPRSRTKRCMNEP